MWSPVMNRSLRLVLFCVFGSCFGLMSSSTVSAQEKILRAGAYAQDITPVKWPVSVNGGFADRLAREAHDPLHARCLVLDDGTTRIALVVCDSCMIPREITDEAKRLAHKATGIPPERILISATHTHTAPTVAGVFQSEPNPDYVKFLPVQIAKGIAKAAANLEPAKLGWGVGKNDRQVYNRRWKMKQVQTDPFGRMKDLVRMNPGYLNPGLIEPAGPIDPDVSFVSVLSKEGMPRALLANYSLHYVGGLPALSADYFGIFADRIGALLGAGKTTPAFVGIMSNGTSGDINNVNYGKEGPGPRKPGEQARVVASDIAETVHKAWKGIEHRDWVPLKMVQREIELGVRLPSKKDVEYAQAILAKAKKPVLSGAPEVYARETVLLAKYPPKVKIILQAVRIGDLAIVTTPCETFVEIGLEIKEKSPFKHTFTIELANGYNGYLPTPRQHEWGGYETWRARSSYLEENASVAVTRNLLQMLDELKR